MMNDHVHNIVEYYVQFPPVTFGSGSFSSADGKELDLIPSYLCLHSPPQDS